MSSSPWLLQLYVWQEGEKKTQRRRKRNGGKRGMTTNNKALSHLMVLLFFNMIPLQAFFSGTLPPSPSKRLLCLDGLGGTEPEMEKDPASHFFICSFFVKGVNYNNQCVIWWNHGEGTVNVSLEKHNFNFNGGERTGVQAPNQVSPPPHFALSIFL